MVYYTLYLCKSMFRNRIGKLRITQTNIQLFLKMAWHFKV